MKKLIVAVAAVLATVASYGQGAVQFENFTIPDAQIFMPDGTTPVPAEGLVQLWSSDGATAYGTPSNFEVTNPGFFFAGVVDIPGVPAGTETSFLVRAWMGGGTFAEAQANGLPWGEQPSSPVTIQAPPNTPLKVQFDSFELVPEPSTIVLGVIGAAALLLRRRK